MYKNKYNLSYIVKFVLSILIIPTNIYAICYDGNNQANIQHAGSGWCYEQSTFQMFYNFNDAYITVDNEEIELAGGDVLAAFKHVDLDGILNNNEDDYEICLGWSNIVIFDNNISYQVYMNGSDGLVEGLNDGEIPTHYRIWDDSEGIAYDAIIDNKEPFFDANNDGCYNSEDGDTYTDVNGNELWDPSIIPGFAPNTQHLLQKIKGFDTEVDCNGDAIIDDCSNPNQAGCAFLDDCRICLGGGTCLDDVIPSFFNGVDGEFITENDFGGGYDCNGSCPDEENYGYQLGECGVCLSPDLETDFWIDCNGDCHPTLTPIGCSGDSDCGLREYDSLYYEYPDSLAGSGCCHPDDMSVWFGDYDLDLLGDPGNEYLLCSPSLLDSIVTNNFDQHPDCNSNSVDDCGICDGFYLDEGDGIYNLGEYFSDDNNNGVWDTEEEFIDSGDGINDYIDCLGTCNPEYASPYIIAQQESLGMIYGAIIDDCDVCDIDFDNDNDTCTGCTDPDAQNYDENATINDHSCYFGVWPGDTWPDGIVNFYDIIPVGVFWGQQGTPRTLTTGNDYTWQQQIGYDNWENTAALYADANGDGIVNIFDILVIFINYNNTTEYSLLSSTINDYYNEIDLNLYRDNFQQIYNSLPNDEDNNEIQLYLEEVFGFESNIELPQEFKLYQNRPNPFNPVTKIFYEIPSSALVSIVITNIVGEIIIKNQVNIKEPGIYNYTFDGSSLSSGIYFYQIETSNGINLKKKMMLIK